MLATPVRPWTSWMVTGNDLLPSVVPAPTVALYEKVPSPGVASPLLPSSKSDCEALPPIEVRSAVTVMLVEVGFWPGVTETVRSVDCDGATLAGVAVPLPVGLVAPRTVRVIVAAPVRAWASLRTTLMIFAPELVAPLTMALTEKMLSPGVTSPLVPSSYIVCDALPPIGVRSAMAVMPVLAGDWPGVTATLSSVMPVAETVDGVAEPAPTRPPQLHAVVALLRGLTAPVVKSVLLWSVSVQPLSIRDTLSVALGVPVAVPPSLQLAVDP